MLKFLGTTSDTGDCPTAWETETEYLIQGSIVTDPAVLAAIRERGNGIPDYETVVAVPPRHSRSSCPRTPDDRCRRPARRAAPRVHAQRVALGMPRRLRVPTRPRCGGGVPAWSRT